MNDKIEIKWPWEMVWTESVEALIEDIKASLPPDHELHGHDLFPGIKRAGRPIFIVDDDTTGEYLLVDFEKAQRWKRSKRKVPTITVLKTREEVATMIEKDHRAEVKKYKDDENHE
jgi:hypothetical protein